MGIEDHIDISTGLPSVGPQGAIRIARQGGALFVSVDGGVFVPIGQEGAGAAEAAIAQSLIGSGAQGLGAVFHLTAEQMQLGATLFATGSVTAAAQAGFYRFSSSAVAAQTANLVLAGPARSTVCRVGQPWYASGRFAVSTAITAQTQATVGLTDINNATQANMGVTGSVSTVFFCLVGAAGGNIVTTVPIDTAFHTHRAWRVGGTTFYSIDGVVFTGASDLAQPSSVGANLLNGTDAVNRQLDLVWFGAACQNL